MNDIGLLKVKSTYTVSLAPIALHFHPLEKLKKMITVRKVEKKNKTNCKETMGDNHSLLNGTAGDNAHHNMFTISIFSSAFF